MVRAAFSDRAAAPLLFQNRPQAECGAGYSKTGVAASAGAAGRKNVRRCAGYLRFYAAFAPCRSLGRDRQLQCSAECSRCSSGILRCSSLRSGRRASGQSRRSRPCAGAGRYAAAAGNRPAGARRRFPKGCADSADYRRSV